MRASGAIEALLDPTALSFEAAGLIEQARLIDLPDRSRDAQTRSSMLAIENISLSFGGVTALANIDLEVGSGEIRAIIGPNGAGKSSLLNVVSGLYRPDRGSVRFAERRFNHMPTAQLARLGIARTFQNLAVFKGLSVIDNVVMGLSGQAQSGFLAHIFGTPGGRREAAQQRGAAEAIIEFLHLSPVRDRIAGTLPYGTQKRVELARALVAQPKLLLLDEPMAGMTAPEKQELAAFIRNARDAYGTSIVLIEHDLGIVTDLSDRIAVLDYGRKIADGTPRDICADPAVIDAYLGVAHDHQSGWPAQ